MLMVKNSSCHVKQLNIFTGLFAKAFTSCCVLNNYALLQIIFPSYTGTVLQYLSPSVQTHPPRVRQTAARSLRARTGYLCAQGERWNPLQPLCAYLAALQAVRRGKEHDENLNWAF